METYGLVTFPIYQLLGRLSSYTKQKKNKWTRSDFVANQMNKQFPYSIQDFKVRREYFSEDQQRKEGKGYQKGAVFINCPSSNGDNNNNKCYLVFKKKKFRIEKNFNKRNKFLVENFLVNTLHFFNEFNTFNF